MQRANPHFVIDFIFKGHFQALMNVLDILRHSIKIYSLRQGLRNIGRSQLQS